ncbi:MAG TPA: carbohydrate-binding module family 20 domain-containing protein [Acidobacteriota bacterium]|nr:carbohydrate-binding module family 20 domain-containing protein [Acidobacteriota bacterium]
MNRLSLTCLFCLLALSFTLPAALAQSDPYGYPARTAMVQLFEWKYTDIAEECENVLGPKGFAAVQISPPSEHRVMASEGYPWWQRYQPVSYSLNNSRSGTLTEFVDMIDRCKDQGVSVYVDTVINHTTGRLTGGFCDDGSDGTEYCDLYTEGLYSSSDFHLYGPPGCGSDNDIVDFSDAWEVRNCELLNLADLKTESSYVRGKITDYMNDLLALGVDGFRIDAAKHITPADLSAIKSGLDDTTGGAEPYIYQEVIADSAIPESDYFSIGDTTEFTYSEDLTAVFKTGELEWLVNFDYPSWGGLIDGPFAVVFVDNHDTQRKDSSSRSLYYADGQDYYLASAFMMTWPYGYARAMSSYHYSDFNQGPPSDSSGNTDDVYNGGGGDDCNSTDWVCEHRSPYIANLVGFRNYVVGESVTNWWDNGTDLISFSRGSKGWVVINKESSDANQWFDTNLAAGQYCEAVSGGIDGSNACNGRTVVVNNSGWAKVKTASNDVTAIHIGAKRSMDSGKSYNHFQCENGSTNWGENIYVVGSISALGSWNTANARILNPDHYPYWQAVLDDLPANTYVEWKCIKKDSGGNVLQWESGSNNSFTTASNGTQTSTYGEF